MLSSGGGRAVLEDPDAPVSFADRRLRRIRWADDEVTAEVMREAVEHVPGRDAVFGAAPDDETRLLERRSHRVTAIK